MSIHNIKLHYKPHDAQRLIHNNDHRFKIVCCGRRMGKTTCVAAELIRRITRGDFNKFSKIAVIGPTYAITDRTVDAIKLIIRSTDIFQISETKPRKLICTLNGVEVIFLSADNPDSLRGYGFSLVILDEADFIPDNVFYEILRPALSDNKGQLIAISTPRRKGSWFHKMFLQGMEENDEIKSFHFPSSMNPFLDVKEIESAKKFLPELSFRREYLAEYTNDGGEVFIIGKDVYKCEVCNCKGPVSIGIDLAKSVDFTVILGVCEECNSIKFIERFNQISWDIQKKMIIEIIKREEKLGGYPSVTMDSTGLGDVVYDDLVNSGVTVTPYKFSASSKHHLISNLRAKINTNMLYFPRNIENMDILIREMEGFVCEMTSTGGVRYGNGSTVGHDDCVIGLALAVEGLQGYIHPITNAQFIKDDGDVVEIKWESTWY